MCNLYSVTKGQSAIRDLFAVKHDRAGNLPPLPAILPDQMAPIVRLGAEGGRELVMARWGMPAPPQHGGQLVTNIRNLDEPALARMARQEKPLRRPRHRVLRIRGHEAPKTPIWFALSQDRPLFAFAGLWTPWRGVRGPKNAPVEGEHELFGLLTTEANGLIAPIHPKAMPVILMTPAEVEQWLEAETPEALALQRPVADDVLRIVAKGERSDEPISLNWTDPHRDLERLRAMRGPSA